MKPLFGWEVDAIARDLAARQLAIEMLERTRPRGAPLKNGLRGRWLSMLMIGAMAPAIWLLCVQGLSVWLALAGTLLAYAVAFAYAEVLRLNVRLEAALTLLALQEPGAQPAADQSARCSDV